MKTLHLVRPELRGFLHDAPVATMDADHLAALRANPRAFPALDEVPGVAVEERRIPGPVGAPDLRILLYRPEPRVERAPAILHIHGGGYVVGSPEMMGTANRKLVAALGCLIVSVAYRLPPETPYPGPLDDCYTALAWLHDHADELGVDRARIAIKGESAGGGLAAGLALLARDRGEVPLAFQCLIVPMIDDRPPAEPHPYAGEFVWNLESNRFGWNAYLAGRAGGADVAAYAAAACATDLAGLPPTWIMTATLDLFVEENIDYARRLARAGVAVELTMYQGAYHGFHMAGDTVLHRRFERDCLEVLREGLAIAPPF